MDRDWGVLLLYRIYGSFGDDPNVFCFLEVQSKKTEKMLDDLDVAMA